MLTTPFLTQLDSRAAIKGSRDPLGVQTIWTRFGRHVVGNLTTVSTSARDFTVLLLGYHFAERLSIERAGSDLATFLKWEQMAGYARAHINNDWSFRGTERVRAALAEGTKLTISDDAKHQILANQKIYGLWGLYTVPAKSSALLSGDPTRLTPAARDLVDNVYIPLLEKSGGSRVMKRLEVTLSQPSTRIAIDGADSSWMTGVASVMKSRLLSVEREFFRAYLLFGGPENGTEGRQTALARLFASTPGEFVRSPQTIDGLSRRSEKQGDAGSTLANRLARIRACEAVIAPSTLAFLYILGLDGKTVADAAARFRAAWGARVPTVIVNETRELKAELGGNDASTGSRWLAIAESMCEGDYRSLVELLVEQNRFVMDGRGGAAWVEIRDGRLHVRFHEENAELPSRDELPRLWRHSYFLDALWLMTKQIEVSA